MHKIHKTIFTYIIVTALLFASLKVILSGHYDDAAQKWAFGTIGAILGNFLKR